MATMTPDDPPGPAEGIARDAALSALAYAAVALAAWWAFGG